VSGQANAGNFGASVRDLRKPVVDLRVLIMHGDDDQIVPIAGSALLSAKLVKNGGLKVCKGLPHGMAVTHADRVNADFLRSFGNKCIPPPVEEASRM
jgi:pimeloyl-ACP methyl ester carboxylesterase